MSYLRLLIFVRTNYVHCEKPVKLDAQLYLNLNAKVTRLQKISLLIRMAKIARLIRMTSRMTVSIRIKDVRMM